MSEGVNGRKTERRRDGEIERRLGEGENILEKTKSFCKIVPYFFDLTQLINYQRHEYAEFY